MSCDQNMALCTSSLLIYFNQSLTSNKHDQQYIEIYQIEYQIYKLQLENYKVKAFMITPYQMSLPFLKKDEHEIPMVSFHRIQQEGIDVLL